MEWAPQRRRPAKRISAAMQRGSGRQATQPLARRSVIVQTVQEADMARDVLFIQGGGSDTHDHWDNKLVESLKLSLGQRYLVHYPRMPNEDEPTYAGWKKAIGENIDQHGDGLIIVGHSIGAMILVNALASSPPNYSLYGVFLIATPFIGEGGWTSREITVRKNLGASLPYGVPIFLYHGDKDDTAPIDHVDLYAQAIPQAKIKRLEGRDHQLNNDMHEVAHDILSLG